MSAAHVPHHPLSGLRGHDWQPLLLAVTTALIVLVLAAAAMSLLTAGEIAKEQPAPVTVNEGPEEGTP